MAVKTKSVEQFSSAYHAAIAVEKSKRGLGNTFHDAVITLLNENPNATPEELVELFRETVTEVENSLMGELKEAFGADADPKELSAWTQYKSNYKKALEMVDRRDIMKCTGPYQVNMKLQEVRKALKEKENGGLTDENPADNGRGDNPSAGSKAGDNPGLDKLPGDVQATLREALRVLSGLPEDAASEVAENFRNAAAAKLRRLGLAKKKVGAAAGNGAAAKVAANS